MVQVKFSPVNCPLLPPLPFNCPCHLINQSFLSRKGDIHLHAPPLFMGEVKWVGIFHVRIFWMGIFRGRV